MRIVALITSVLLALPVYGASIARDTRDDWRSIDAAMRHLERDGAEGIERALMHLRPMEERRRTFMLRRVNLGSDDEVKLVNRQYARAGTPGNQDDMKRTLIVGVFFWLYHFCADVLDAIIPGLGLALPFIVALYLYVRYGRRVINSMYADAEANMGEGQRKAVFTSDAVRQDYAKQKRKGKL
jgi:hypothetical protein